MGKLPLSPQFQKPIICPYDIGLITASMRYPSGSNRPRNSDRDNQVANAFRPARWARSPPIEDFESDGDDIIKANPSLAPDI
jgi:hypothetical protein